MGDKIRTRTVAYLRVSTDKPADRGVSLEAQRAKVEAYATLYDLDLIDVAVDAGVSAKSTDRPGLDRILGMLKPQQADALLVVRLDRLTGSVPNLGRLVETHFAPGKAALLSFGEQIDTRSAAGRLVLNVLGSVSQWEREAIAERTAAAMQQKAEQGEDIGGHLPCGFRLSEDGAQLVPHSAEQAVIAEARRVRASGSSFARVADALARRGIRSRTGRPFAPIQIARMVA